ncbi:MAG: hypothetical protein GY719_03225 [bacterium]|nr:hypothetical protein [bacterium]
MNELDPISFRFLIDRILAPAKHHFRQVFLPIAVPLAVCGVGASLLQVGWLKTLMGGGDVGQVLPMVGGIFVIMIGILAAYGLGFSALTVGSLDAVAGRRVSMGRAWLFALQPRVFGTLIVISVANTLSFLMCFLPALYVVPILSFVLPAMVEEDVYGWAAIRRSSELAHYNPTGRWTDSAWLQILVLLSVGLVINYAVSLLVQLPFLVAQQIIIFRDAASGQMSDPATLLAGMLWLQIPAQILSAMATAASWLFWTFGISLLYREIRRRKEGQDLKQAIDELTGAPDALPAPATSV